MDIHFRTWSSEDPSVALGGSVRVEVDGRSSVAIVPRAEYQLELGPVILRPGIGAPIFFAPFSMAGVEGTIGARLALTGPLGVVGTFAVDAFFFGSDVPDKSVVLMFNGTLGIDVQF